MMKLIVKSFVFHAQPNMIVVLGDVLYNQDLSHNEFYHIVERYYKTFVVHHNVRCFSLLLFSFLTNLFDQISVVNLSGNHDIGYGAEVSFGEIETLFSFSIV